MLEITADGEDRHRLADGAGRPVGWIRGHTVGFTGFATEGDAISAALFAAKALAGILRRSYPGWPHQDPGHVPGEREVRVVRDAGFDWIVAGPIPLGRLLAPLADSPRGGFAVEFLLPSYSREEVVRSAARALHAALFSHSEGMRPPERVEGASRSGLPFTDEPIRVA